MAIAGSKNLVVGIFAKAPEPGQVKTRLAVAVSPAWAAAVAEAFLLDVTERLATVAARRVLCFSPTQARGYFESIAGPRFILSPQADGDLGRRMAAFFTDQFHAGAESVVLVGSDSPTMPIAFIEQAFVELERRDLVLGPATDGGYYLIGCRGDLRSIFEGIPWGTSGVLAATLQIIARAHYRVALLPPWYDVDTLDDWRMLRGHVAAMRHAGVDPGVPHTEKLLQESSE
jgi:rSAM/selenodomain-associated transferase 1